MGKQTYYKAVRPDGTDFRTGTVRWLPESGPPKRKRIVRHPSSTEAVAGEHHTSLAVSTDPTRLPGSSWPLRLMEVEPVEGAPVIRTDQHKRQAVAWRVVREVPAHLRFGPQGEQVVALIDRASRLTATEARDLAAAWDAARYAAGDAARYAAGDAARYAAGDATEARDLDAAWDAAWYAAWDAARDAAWDAAGALAVRDLIGQHGFTQAHYDILVAPWADVIGPVHPDDV